MKLIASWFLLSAADRSADVIAHKTKAKELKAMAVKYRQKAKEESHLAETLYQEQFQSPPQSAFQPSAEDQKVLAALKKKQLIANGEETQGVKVLVLEYSKVSKEYKKYARILQRKAQEEEKTELIIEARKANSAAKQMNQQAVALYDLYRVLQKAEENDSEGTREAKRVLKQHRKKARKLEKEARKLEKVADQLEVQGSVLKYVTKEGLADKGIFQEDPEEEIDSVDREVLASYADLKQEIKSESCLIYGWERCPYCTKAKEMLDQWDIPCKKIDLDSNVREENIKNEVLMAYTDQRSVPNIFVKQMHIGGFSHLQKHLLRCYRKSPKAPQELCDYFNLSKEQAPTAA